MGIEFERETYLLRQGFFQVQNEVGRGLQEETYHQACALWFVEKGLPVASKAPHRLSLRGEEVLRLVPDFVAWDSIVVELKAVARHLDDSEFVQLFNYLKYRRSRLGLLVNMGLDRVEVERILYDPPAPEWLERWDSWLDLIHGEDRAVGLEVRKALQAVYSEHTTGYGHEVISKLVCHALSQQGLDVKLNPVGKSYYGGVEVGESPLDCTVINNRILLTLTALFDDNDFNLLRGKSYLKALGIEWGIAADFGKRRAEVVGFRCPS